MHLRLGTWEKIKRKFLFVYLEGRYKTGVSAPGYEEDGGSYEGWPLEYFFFKKEEPINNRMHIADLIPKNFFGLLSSN